MPGAATAAYERKKEGLTSVSPSRDDVGDALSTQKGTNYASHAESPNRDPEESSIQERSPSLYTHLPSSFFSNLPVLHRSSLLHCRYLSPISPPPPLPSTYPPPHPMAPRLCHSLPWLLLALHTDSV